MLKNEYGDRALNEANKIIKLCMKKKKTNFFKVVGVISGVTAVVAVVLRLI